MSTTILAGCQSAGPGSMGNKEVEGTVIGGTAGGVIGAQFGQGAGRWAGGAIGVIAGAVVGNAIGAYLDDQSTCGSRRACNTCHSCAPQGEVAYWQNGRTGHHTWYQPCASGGHSRYGNYCQEFTTNVIVNGRCETVTGTACRRPNGTWYEI